MKSDIALLFITGGSLDREAPARPPDWMVELARDTGTVVAELRLVPNQPVVFKDDPTHKPRKEDDFIAYTWDHYRPDRRRALAGAAADDQERGSRDGRDHGVHGVAGRRRLTASPASSSRAHRSAAGRPGRRRRSIVVSLRSLPR